MMIEPNCVSVCGGVDPAPLWEDIHALVTSPAPRVSLSRSRERLYRPRLFGHGQAGPLHPP